MPLSKVKLIRGTQSGVADFLKDKLILHKHQNRDRLVSQLKELVVEMGEDIFILCGLTEPEDSEPKLEGFVIGYLNTDHQVYMPQIWVDKKSPKGLSSLLYYKLVLWAEARGAKKILGEMMRSTRGVERRWGFKVLSKTIAVDINDDYQEFIVKRLNKEIEDGKLIRSECTEREVDKQLDQATEGDLGPVGPAVAEGDGGQER